MISGSTIVAPVNTTDVGTILKNSSHTLSVLCKAPTINKWSKYKPVKYPLANTSGFPDWYKANDGFCGFDVGWAQASDPSLTNIVNAYKKGTWNYNPPTGGASAPYRIGDFKGYDNNAVPFLESRINKGSILEVNVMSSNALTLFVYYNDNASSVQISDFGNAAVGLDRSHLAASLYNGNPLENSTATRLQTVISDDPVDRRGTVTFNFTQNDIGTTRWVMLFLASTTVSNNMCIPYNDSNYFLFKVNITQEFPLSATPVRMGNSSMGYYEINRFETIPFASSNGLADVIIFSRIENNGSSAILIGDSASANYALRTKFDSRYTTNMQQCDNSGNAINTDLSVPAKSIASAYFKMPRMFKEFIDSFASDTTQSRGMLTIEAYNKKGGVTAAWQTISPSYMIYVSK